MLTLAIEASNPSLTASPPRCAPGVALGSPDAVLDMEPIRPASRHDDDLIAALDRLGARTGVRPADIRQIAVSIGPGGYTSLRMACATAQMLGLSLGIPCISVPTAAVVLATLRSGLPQKGKVGVALAGKTDQAHLSVFPDARTPVPEYQGLASAADLIARDLRVLVADEHLPESLRNAARQNGLTVITTALDAGALLAISSQFQPGPPGLCVPYYGREPEAVTKWRVLHGGPVPPAGPRAMHDAP